MQWISISQLDCKYRIFSERKGISNYIIQFLFGLTTFQHKGRNFALFKINIYHFWYPLLFLIFIANVNSHLFRQREKQERVTFTTEFSWAWPQESFITSMTLTFSLVDDLKTSYLYSQQFEKKKEITQMQKFFFLKKTLCCFVHGDHF